MKKRLLAAVLVLITLLMPFMAHATNGTPPAQFDGTTIAAESAILMDAKSGEVLFEKNPDSIRSPASITKIMTAYLAILKGNLTDMVTLGDEIGQIVSDSSKAGLKKGDKLSLKDLLYGLMLKSGNDAAMAIAKHIAGSPEAFITMMNETAVSLGMTGTKYMNPHGYNDPGHLQNHYTTARDMAILTKAAFESEDFRTIVGTYSYNVPETADNQAYAWQNGNRLISQNENEQFRYQYATGVKTGFHSDAGQTFVGSAAKDGVDLIAVLFKDTQEGKWTSAVKLFEFGFNNYSSLDLGAILLPTSLTALVKNASADDSNGGLIELVPEITQKAFMTVSRSTMEAKTAELSQLQIQYDFDINALEAPIKAGWIVGNFWFEQDGQKVLSGTLKVSRDVQVRKINIVANPGTNSLEEITPIRKGAPTLIVWGLIILIGVLLVALAYSLYQSFAGRRNPRRKNKPYAINRNMVRRNSQIVRRRR